MSLINRLLNPGLAKIEEVLAEKGWRLSEQHGAGQDKHGLVELILGIGSKSYSCVPLPNRDFDTKFPPWAIQIPNGKSARYVVLSQITLWKGAVQVPDPTTGEIINVNYGAFIAALKEKLPELQFTAPG